LLRVVKSYNASEMLPPHLQKIAVPISQRLPTLSAASQKRLMQAGDVPFQPVTPETTQQGTFPGFLHGMREGMRQQEMPPIVQRLQDSIKKHWDMYQQTGNAHHFETAKQYENMLRSQAGAMERIARVMAGPPGDRYEAHWMQYDSIRKRKKREKKERVKEGDWFRYLGEPVGLRMKTATYIYPGDEVIVTAVKQDSGAPLYELMAAKNGKIAAPQRIDTLESVPNKEAKYDGRRGPKMKALKKGRRSLDPEERKLVMDRGAVWQNGPGHEMSPAVWKSVVDGKTWYVCNTHRAMNVSPTLKGAIRNYDFIKTTAGLKEAGFSRKMLGNLATSILLGGPAALGALGTGAATAGLGSAMPFVGGIAGGTLGRAIFGDKANKIMQWAHAPTLKDIKKKLKKQAPHLSPEEQLSLAKQHHAYLEAMRKGKTAAEEKKDSKPLAPMRDIGLGVAGAGGGFYGLDRLSSAILRSAGEGDPEQMSPHDFMRRYYGPDYEDDVRAARAYTEEGKMPSGVTEMDWDRFDREVPVYRSSPEAMQAIASAPVHGLRARTPLTGEDIVLMRKGYGESSPEYNTTLGEELTHAGQKTTLPGRLAEFFQNAITGGGDFSDYYNRSEELGPRYAHARRMYEMHTGNDVRSPEDAMKAVHWYASQLEKNEAGEELPSTFEIRGDEDRWMPRQDARGAWEWDEDHAHPFNHQDLPTPTERAEEMAQAMPGLISYEVPPHMQDMLPPGALTEDMFASGPAHMV